MSHTLGVPVNLPKRSIAARLYTIFAAATVKAVADDLGSVASRIRAQVDQFFERLSA